MDKKIVLIGAGSAAFGPATLNDIYQSDVLYSSTISLVDTDEEKLNKVYDIVVQENKIKGDKFTIEKNTDRKIALKDADYVICSIEHGDRFFHRWQDHRIPQSHGSTEMMAENGGPGGFFHSARQIPTIVEIAKDAYKANPEVFFINYSNPMSRICLALHRAVPDLNFVGLCHQINLLLRDLPHIIDDKIKILSSLEKIKRYKEVIDKTKITAVGLNHFAFVLDMEDMETGENLMQKFNERLISYYTKDKWDRFHFHALTFEIYRRTGLFPYVGDNHLAEYVQIAKDHCKYEDFNDWIKRMEQGNQGIQRKFDRYLKRLKEDRYPRKGVLGNIQSGERAVAILEGMIEDKNNFEIVNIPNVGIIDNLPSNLVVECTGRINKYGIHGVKVGNIPKSIAALLRIEASIQDVCVEAILKESKDLAINCIAMDVNCGSFKMAEAIFEEMSQLQKKYLPNFK
jgi:alpha-galactosidase